MSVEGRRPRHKPDGDSHNGSAADSDSARGSSILSSPTTPQQPSCCGFSLRGVAQLVARLVWDQDAAGSNPVTSTKKQTHFGYHRQKCRWYRAFRGGVPPQISQLKQKIQTGGSQKLAGSEPQNSIEIHSVLFEMRFFKKGAVFIFRKRALKLQGRQRDGKHQCPAGGNPQPLLR